MLFLQLPREVRDPIYHYYVYEPDGYHFDYESGKLRASDNRPVDLALMYICKAIAVEMQHLALRSNVLHLSTIGSEAERLQAGRFDMYIREIDAFKSETLGSLNEPAYLRYITPELLAKVALKYPRFEPLLQLVHTSEEYVRTNNPLIKEGVYYGSSWGEADSMFRDFQDYLIELLSKDTDFFKTYANSCDRLLRITDEPRRYQYRVGHTYPRNGDQCWSDRVSFVRSEHLSINLKPWSIPTEHEQAQMRTLQGISSSRGNLWKRLRWRYSAVAVAIQFFKSISCDTGLAIRKVVLNEDRRSVGYPECHARGLVQFCSQWPKLHTERRVNIWRNLVTPHVLESLYVEELGYPLETVDAQTEAGERNRQKIDRGWDTFFGWNCAKWITEASVLRCSGMPADSFSLILNGDPAPDHSSQMFELLKDLAAWQVGLDQWYTEKSLNPGILNKRIGRCYASEVFPQAISDTIEAKSIIHCNFPTGLMYDSKQVLNQIRPLVPEHDVIPGQVVYDDYLHHIDRNPVGRRPLLPPLPLRFCHLVTEELMSGEE